MSRDIQKILAFNRKMPLFGENLALSLLQENAHPEAQKFLSRLLGDNNEKVRWLAARALGGMRNLPLEKLILPILNRPKPDLEPGQRPMVVKIVRAGSARDPKWKGRQGAAWVLGSSRDTRFVPELLENLDDPVLDVRLAAIWALGFLRHPDVFPALKVALTDYDGDIRLAAARALGKLGDLRAVPDLLEALENEHRAIQLAIVEALQKLGARFKTLPQIPVCRQCLCRFAEFQIKLEWWWPRYRFHTCRRCHNAAPRWEGASRLVLVIDHRQGNGDQPVLEDSDLFIPWLPNKKTADLDTLMLGEVGSREIEIFLIDWADRTDEWQRNRLKSVPVTLLPEARLEINDQRLLEERFAGVRRLPEMEAGELRKSLGLLTAATTQPL